MPRTRKKPVKTVDENDNEIPAAGVKKEEKSPQGNPRSKRGKTESTSSDVSIETGKGRKKQATKTATDETALRSRGTGRKGKVQVEEEELHREKEDTTFPPDPADLVFTGIKTYSRRSKSGTRKSHSSDSDGKLKSPSRSDEGQKKLVEASPVKSGKAKPKGRGKGKGSKGAEGQDNDLEGPQKKAVRGKRGRSREIVESGNQMLNWKSRRSSMDSSNSIKDETEVFEIFPEEKSVETSSRSSRSRRKKGLNKSDDAQNLEAEKEVEKTDQEGSGQRTSTITGSKQKRGLRSSDAIESLGSEKGTEEIAVQKSLGRNSRSKKKKGTVEDTNESVENLAKVTEDDPESDLKDSGRSSRSKKKGLKADNASESLENLAEDLDGNAVQKSPGKKITSKGGSKDLESDDAKPNIVQDNTVSTSSSPKSVTLESPTTSKSKESPASESKTGKTRGSWRGRQRNLNEEAETVEENNRVTEDLEADTTVDDKIENVDDLSDGEKTVDSPQRKVRASRRKIGSTESVKVVKPDRAVDETESSSPRKGRGVGGTKGKKMEESLTVERGETPQGKEVETAETDIAKKEKAESSSPRKGRGARGKKGKTMEEISVDETEKSSPSPEVHTVETGIAEGENTEISSRQKGRGARGKKGKKLLVEKLLDEGEQTSQNPEVEIADLGIAEDKNTESSSLRTGRGTRGKKGKKMEESLPEERGEMPHSPEVETAEADIAKDENTESSSLRKGRGVRGKKGKKVSGESLAQEQDALNPEVETAETSGTRASRAKRSKKKIEDEVVPDVSEQVLESADVEVEKVQSESSSTASVTILEEAEASAGTLHEEATASKTSPQESLKSSRKTRGKKSGKKVSEEMQAQERDLKEEVKGTDNKEDADLGETSTTDVSSMKSRPSGRGKKKAEDDTAVVQEETAAQAKVETSPAGSARSGRLAARGSKNASLVKEGSSDKTDVAEDVEEIEAKDKTRSKHQGRGRKVGDEKQAEQQDLGDKAAEVIEETEEVCVSDEVVIAGEMKEKSKNKRQGRSKKVSDEKPTEPQELQDEPAEETLETDKVSPASDNVVTNEVKEKPRGKRQGRSKKVSEEEQTEPQEVPVDPVEGLKNEISPASDDLVTVEVKDKPKSKRQGRGKKVSEEKQTEPQTQEMPDEPAEGLQNIEGSETEIRPASDDLHAVVVEVKDQPKSKSQGKGKKVSEEKQTESQEVQDEPAEIVEALETEEVIPASEDVVAIEVTDKPRNKRPGRGRKVPDEKPVEPQVVLDDPTEVVESSETKISTASDDLQLVAVEVIDKSKSRRQGRGKKVSEEKQTESQEVQDEPAEVVEDLETEEVIPASEDVVAIEVTDKPRSKRQGRGRKVSDEKATEPQQDESAEVHVEALETEEVSPALDDLGTAEVKDKPKSKRQGRGKKVSEEKQTESQVVQVEPAEIVEALETEEVSPASDDVGTSEVKDKPKNKRQGRSKKVSEEKPAEPQEVHDGSTEEVLETDKVSPASDDVVTSEVKPKSKRPGRGMKVSNEKPAEPQEVQDDRTEEVLETGEIRPALDNVVTVEVKDKPKSKRKGKGKKVSDEKPTERQEVKVGPTEEVLELETDMVSPALDNVVTVEVKDKPKSKRQGKGKKVSEEKEIEPQDEVSPATCNVVTNEVKGETRKKRSRRGMKVSDEKQTESQEVQGEPEEVVEGLETEISPASDDLYEVAVEVKDKPKSKRQGRMRKDDNQDQLKDQEELNDNVTVEGQLKDQARTSRSGNITGETPEKDESQVETLETKESANDQGLKSTRQRRKGKLADNFEAQVQEDAVDSQTTDVAKEIEGHEATEEQKCTGQTKNRKVTGKKKSEEDKKSFGDEEADGLKSMKESVRNTGDKEETHVVQEESQTSEENKEDEVNMGRQSKNQKVPGEYENKEIPRELELGTTSQASEKSKESLEECLASFSSHLLPCGRQRLTGDNEEQKAVQEETASKSSDELQATEECSVQPAVEVQKSTRQGRRREMSGEKLEPRESQEEAKMKELDTFEKEGAETADQELEKVDENGGEKPKRGRKRKVTDEKEKGVEESRDEHTVGTDSEKSKGNLLQKEVELGEKPRRGRRKVTDEKQLDGQERQDEVTVGTVSEKSERQVEELVEKKPKRQKRRVTDEKEPGSEVIDVEDKETGPEDSDGKLLDMVEKLCEEKPKSRRKRKVTDEKEQGLKHVHGDIQTAEIVAVDLVEDRENDCALEKVEGVAVGEKSKRGRRKKVTDEKEEGAQAEDQEDTGEADACSLKTVVDLAQDKENAECALEKVEGVAVEEKSKRGRRRKVTDEKEEGAQAEDQEDTGEADACSLKTVVDLAEDKENAECALEKVEGVAVEEKSKRGRRMKVTGEKPEGTQAEDQEDTGEAETSYQKTSVVDLADSKENAECSLEKTGEVVVVEKPKRSRRRKVTGENEQGSNIGDGQGDERVENVSERTMELEKEGVEITEDKPKRGRKRKVTDEKTEQTEVNDNVNQTVEDEAKEAAGKGSEKRDSSVEEKPKKGRRRKITDEKVEGSNEEERCERPSEMGTDMTEEAVPVVQDEVEVEDVGKKSARVRKRKVTDEKVQGSHEKGRTVEASTEADVGQDLAEVQEVVEERPKRARKRNVSNEKVQKSNPAGQTLETSSAADVGQDLAEVQEVVEERPKTVRKRNVSNEKVQKSNPAGQTETSSAADVAEVQEIVEQRPKRGRKRNVTDEKVQESTVAGQTVDLISQANSRPAATEVEEMPKRGRKRNATDKKVLELNEDGGTVETSSKTDLGEEAPEVEIKVKRGRKRNATDEKVQESNEDREAVETGSKTDLGEEAPEVEIKVKRGRKRNVTDEKVQELNKDGEAVETGSKANMGQEAPEVQEVEEKQNSGRKRKVTNEEEWKEDMACVGDGTVEKSSVPTDREESEQAVEERPKRGRKTKAVNEKEQVLEVRDTDVSQETLDQDGNIKESESVENDSRKRKADDQGDLKDNDVDIGQEGAETVVQELQRVDADDVTDKPPRGRRRKITDEKDRGSCREVPEDSATEIALGSGNTGLQPEKGAEAKRETRKARKRKVTDEKDAGSEGIGKEIGGEEFVNELGLEPKVVEETQQNREESDVAELRESEDLSGANTELLESREEQVENGENVLGLEESKEFEESSKEGKNQRGIENGEASEQVSAEGSQEVPMVGHVRPVHGSSSERGEIVQQLEKDVCQVQADEDSVDTSAQNDEQAAPTSIQVTDVPNGSQFFDIVTIQNIKSEKLDKVDGSSIDDPRRHNLFGLQFIKEEPRNSIDGDVARWTWKPSSLCTIVKEERVSPVVTEAYRASRKRKSSGRDEAPPAKILKEGEGFFDIVDGEERSNEVELEVSTDMEQSGRNSGQMLVMAEVHADEEGIAAPPNSSSERATMISSEDVRDLNGNTIKRFSTPSDVESIDEICDEDAGRKCGARKGRAAKNSKRFETETSNEPSRQSKRSKKEVTEEMPGPSGVRSQPKGRSRKPKQSDMKRMFVGAHVSISGGLHKAVKNAVAIGAKAFGLFLKNQRQWNSKPISEAAASKFKKACQENNFPPHLILPHGCYLMNCGSPKDDMLQKSRDLLVDEMTRCEQLGLLLFNFHPGTTCGEITSNECISRIAESINYAHKKTKYCKTVLENMCRQGHTIGGRFSELRAIIDKVKDKSRVGVCLDTCHAMAAGYDLSTESGFTEMMDDFESTIGLEYLLAVHVNDSDGKSGCHQDRHENIGQGHITMAGFRRVMNDSRFENIPMILETPGNIDDLTEIKMLYKLCRK